MALPELSRTWQFQVNQTIAGSGTTIVQNRELLLALVRSLIGQGNFTDSDNSGPEGGYVTVANAWTVVASCDGATFSHAGVNKWTTASKLIWANVVSGTAHSWIVLQQAGIASKFQLLIDCNASPGDGSQLTLKVSHLGFGAANGGVDGTTLLAPTALQAVPLISDHYWGASATINTPTVLHVSMSADGCATRVRMCRASVTVGHWMFSLPGNALPGWTNPYAVLIGGITGNVEAMAFTDVHTLTPTLGLRNTLTGISNSGVPFIIHPGTPGIAGTPFPVRYTAAGAISLAYPFFEIVLGGWSNGMSDPSLGILVDIYFGITAHVTGIGYPGVAVDPDRPRQFMKFGPFVDVWNNSVAVTS